MFPRRTAFAPKLANAIDKQKPNPQRRKKRFVPINTARLLPTLTSHPLLKTCLVDIIPARSLAPHYLLLVRFELHEADWTVAADFLPVAFGI